MSDWVRLKERGSDDFERSLLESASLDHPEPSSKRQTLAALGVGGAATAATLQPPMTSAGSASSGASGGGATMAGAAGAKVGLPITAAVIGKWFAIGTVGGLGIAGALATLGPGSEESAAAAKPPAVLEAPVGRPSATVSAESAEAEAVPRTAGLDDNDSTEQAPVDPSDLPAAEPPEPRAPKPSGISERRASAATKKREASDRPPTIADEVASLDRARGALARGDASAALTVLSEHHRRFRGGALAPEARVLRIQALAANGQGGKAKRMARDFVARYPNSPHQARLRRLLDAD